MRFNKKWRGQTSLMGTICLIDKRELCKGLSCSTSLNVCLLILFWSCSSSLFSFYYRFSPGITVSSTNITEILLNVVLNTITLTLLKNDNKNLYNIICLHLYYKGKAKRFLKFQITKFQSDPWKHKDSLC
jgi:hypothetical protein